MPDEPVARFTIYASHHQFTMTDDDPAVWGDPYGWADPEAMRRQLVVTCAGQVAVGTTSYGDVDVEVVLADGPPGDADPSWQHVVEASITIEAGGLVFESVANAGSPEAPRVVLAAGIYRMSVRRRGLETVDPQMEEGREECQVVLWPGAVEPPRLIREHERSHA